MLRNECLSPLGKQKVEDIHFSTQQNVITEAIDIADEFIRIIKEEEPFPESHYYDVTESLHKIRIEGMFLEVSELFDFKRSFETIKSIINYLKKGVKGDYPNLKKLTSDITIFPFIFERLNQIISRHGEIRDNASNELQNIRRSKLHKQSEASQRIHKILKKAQQEGWVEQDVTLSVREGRSLIPVPTAYKRKIKGYVQDESSTGRTSYIEPAEIVEINNEIRELGFAENREIIRILKEFADQLRPYLEEIFDAYRFLGKIDFIRAKARFSVKINAIRPEVINTRNEFDWKGAKHPLLLLSFKKSNREVIPLDIRVTRNDKIVVISGPNAGGKSVCLKTVGLIQYMLQCGLPVPVEKESKMGMFKRLFIDIGDEQSIEDDLSTYSSHLTNMKYFVQHATPQTLFLIDEFGSGTEPTLGASIAEAILEEINAKHAKGIITTHYTALKHYATATNGIVNGAMLFNSREMRPLFRLEIGKPGRSFAFEIAQKIGLPNSILKKAGKKIGQEHLDFEENLKQIEKDRRYLINIKKRLQQKENQLDKSIKRYNQETEIFLEKQKAILKKANEQAQERLDAINKRIENTIYEIKKNKAEKKITKQARQQLEDFKQDVLNEQKNEQKHIEERIERIIEKKKRRKKHEKEQKQTVEPPEKTDPVIRVNDKVRIKGQDTPGDVIERQNDDVTISFGNIKTTVSVERLEKLSRNEVREIEKRQHSPSEKMVLEISERKMNFSPHLDVRGKRADEALQSVMEFVDEALIAEVRELSILHGTGNGILRQILRDYLNTVDVVKSVRDERVELGGAGISLVTLDY